MLEVTKIISVVCKIQRVDFECNLILAQKLIIVSPLALREINTFTAVPPMVPPCTGLAANLANSKISLKIFYFLDVRDLSTKLSLYRACGDCAIRAPHRGVLF